jgi:dipeptidyl aminopeptidase/acylaminoacyl peptidase
MDGAVAFIACSVLTICAFATSTVALASDGHRATPGTKNATPRSVTLDDWMAIRHVDTLSVSPDGRQFAIFVHQADASNNTFRTTWFVGSTTQPATLIALGGGGEIGPAIMFTGHMPGMLAGQDSQWSPDGSWIAYKKEEGGQVQLWRSRPDGSAPQMLTHNPADVREFAWSQDGRKLYFSAGSDRDKLRTRKEQESWKGYNYDEDLWMFTDLLGPRLIQPPETNLTTWIIKPDTSEERPADESEREAFAQHPRKSAITAVPPSVASRWPDDTFRLCNPSKDSRLICVRENASTPDQIVAIDPKRRRLQVLADLNSDFTDLRQGKVERFEWDIPTHAWNEPGGELAGLYAKRTYGYILYPPDFDPAKKYPVFIDPYVASGFNSLGAEHPLHVYAANGIIVLRTAFPQHTEQAIKEGKATMKRLYSAELGFPHLTMLMESTLRGLDTVIARGFIDEHRIGIGGVSHGTFVPLYLMQKHDRIAAISISSPSWGAMQYYWPTRKARDTIKSMTGPDEDWTPNPEDIAGRDFWRQIDIADHIDSIEAPILMHLAAEETYAMVRFIRNLADANKPYDTYIYPAETHLKWQPAHLRSIAERNLDWFMFWLQGQEDHTPEKATQYRRWRELRQLQQAE